MPELRGKQFADFVPVDINTDTIPFKDKMREKQRQKLLEQQRKEKTENEGRRKFIKNKAWSKQKAKKKKKKKMNDKRKREEVKFAVLLLNIVNSEFSTRFIEIVFFNRNCVGLSNFCITLVTWV